MIGAFTASGYWRFFLSLRDNSRGVTLRGPGSSRLLELSAIIISLIMILIIIIVVVVIIIILFYCANETLI